MRNDDFGRLVDRLAGDPALLQALIGRSGGGADIAAILPQAVSARAAAGAGGVALVLARTLTSNIGRGERVPLGPCADSCEASRLADGPVDTTRTGFDTAAMLYAACGGDVTCCCTSGTCGGPTCGGSTCDVTCAGDSCGATCGDSCGSTSNADIFLDRHVQPADVSLDAQAWRWR